jgi:hypothetical protein
MRSSSTAREHHRIASGRSSLGNRRSSTRRPIPGRARSGATASTRSACGARRAWRSAAGSTASAIPTPTARAATAARTARTSTRTATSTPERHLRYVLPLDGTSPYLERSTVETGTLFQALPHSRSARPLPLSVGGAITEADLRAVRHLRITVVGPAGTVQMARMRLVGSRWIKRDGDGVLRGSPATRLANVGRLEVSAVSRLTEGAAYASPPGVLEELDDPTTAFAGQGIEFNERSLGIEFEDMPPGGRAEVYHRFPQRPRNFLSYDEARLWAVARAGDFGPGSPTASSSRSGATRRTSICTGRRCPSRPVRPSHRRTGSPSSASTSPAGTICGSRRRCWSRRLPRTRRSTGGGVVADSTYAVVLNDRGRAPNLAAVREISMGVWNGGQLPSTGEVWVDELRLGGAVRDPGVAGSLDVELEAGGVLTSRLSMTNRGAFFRQLRDDPTYQTDQTVLFVSTLALDRWMPAEWGVDMPVTLELGRARARRPDSSRTPICGPTSSPRSGPPSRAAHASAWGCASERRRLTRGWDSHRRPRARMPVTRHRTGPPSRPNSSRERSTPEWDGCGSPARGGRHRARLRRRACSVPSFPASWRPASRMPG